MARRVVQNRGRAGPKCERHLAIMPPCRTAPAGRPTSSATTATACATTASSSTAPPAPRSSQLLLAFPVVERRPRTAEHDQVTCHAACADLARIEVLDDVRGDECRKHEDANRRLGSIPDLMRPG